MCDRYIACTIHVRNLYGILAQNKNFKTIIKSADNFKVLV